MESGIKLVVWIFVVKVTFIAKSFISIESIFINYFRMLNQ